MTQKIDCRRLCFAKVTPCTGRRECTTLLFLFHTSTNIQNAFREAAHVLFKKLKFHFWCRKFSFTTEIIILMILNKKIVFFWLKVAKDKLGLGRLDQNKP